MGKHFVLLILFTVFNAFFSGDIVAQIFFNNLESDTIAGNWIGNKTITKGNAFSGDFFSETNGDVIYGLGIEQPVPDEYFLKNVILKISGYVRTNKIPNNSVYTITLNNNNKTSLWKGIQLSSILKDTTNWFEFSDSIVIPARDTKNTIIKTYMWNRDKHSATYIDDLKFELLPLSEPSFLPQLSDAMVNKSSAEAKTFFTNNWFNVFIDESNIVFTGKKGDTIIDNISYYSNKTFNDAGYKELSTWKFIKSKSSSNGKRLIFKCKTKRSLLVMTIICDYNSPTVEFFIDEKYRSRQEVYRESVVVNYHNDINHIFRNNRTVDSDNILSEYWLDQQGLQVGNGANSMIIYHTPFVSSQQLNTTDKQLFINLDYYHDHPFFRFPLAPDSSNWKLDESQSHYNKKAKLTYSFKIAFGSDNNAIPRFMKNPSGYEATYIWTEHADFTDLRTNRATYFGSELITDADSSTGGFVFYDVPVTKSVFYDNPDSITNFDASHGMFTSLESTIKTDTAFEDFLFQIRDKGNDVCLHTPEQYTTTQERFKEALSYMQIHFGSPSWIDHGNNNGPQNNREDLICDATLKDSPYYAIELWDDYGVKYLHNAYYEEMFTYEKWQFEPSLEKPYSGFGDFFPKKDYYKFPTKTKGLYHWPTTSAIFVYQPFLWDYLFNEDKLRNMIVNRHTEFNHVYPAWTDPLKGMWTYGEDSVIIAQQGFNKALNTLDILRDEGLLNLTTIADYLDYRTALDSIEYIILPDDRIKITNNNSVAVKGLSFAVQSAFVTVDGLIPAHKKSGKDIIFWFDIEPGESRIVRMINQ